MTFEIDDTQTKKYGTAQELLAALRSGNNQKLELTVGLAVIPCRLVNAIEEAGIIVRAKPKADKINPDGIKRELIESVCIQKDILAAATTINGMPGLPLGFLDLLTNPELEAIYDQYISLCHTINPNIQSLSQDEILQVVDGIKKKSLSTKNLFSYQLAEVGKFFLDVVLPNSLTVNERG
jgi:hypothetical protein